MAGSRTVWPHTNIAPYHSDNPGPTASVVPRQQTRFIPLALHDTQENVQKKKRVFRSMELDRILPSTAQTILPRWRRQTQSRHAAAWQTQMRGHKVQGDIARDLPSQDAALQPSLTPSAKSKPRLTQADGQGTEVSPFT